MNQDSAPDLGAIFLFAVLTAIVFAIGWKRHFFAFPSESRHWPVPIRWFHVVAVFIIYFGVAMLIAPFVGNIIRHTFFSGNTSQDLLGYASWLNFINSCLIFAFLFFYLSRIPQVAGKIWQRQSPPSFKDDASFAALAWLISFPLVLFLSQLLDYIVTVIFQVPAVPEQLAVHFLKMTFHDPLYFALAVTTIIIFAPLIEETLFRGFLQSFIRQHLGSKQAIFITSFLFAFFHYSPEQGVGNIPIVGSLFALALFLGFIYEKRGSLAAPMFLHAAFNGISVLNLYYLGGFPKGPL